MPTDNSEIIFAQDPFLYLDKKVSAGEDALWLPGRQLYIADGLTAREILTNTDGHFQEHSDFFDSGGNSFKTRSVQSEVARNARTLLQNFLNKRKEKLPELVKNIVLPTSHWPDTGNWLLYEHMHEAILAPKTSLHLRTMLKDVVRRAVLAGAKEKHNRLTRALFRRQFKHALGKETRLRRSKKNQEAEDILDILIAATSKKSNKEDLFNTFLSFLFAIVGSIGFTLGWCLYLMSTNSKWHAKPEWIVRESLRLWPVAWNMDRRPKHAHQVLSTNVKQEDHVMVCPYAVHRNPRYWQDPDKFSPERWSAKSPNNAFIPFGAGKHTCIAAGLSMQFVEEIINIIQNYELTMESSNTRPIPRPALTPPHYTLQIKQ